MKRKRNDGSVVVVVVVVVVGVGCWVVGVVVAIQSKRGVPCAGLYMLPTGGRSISLLPPSNVDNGT